MKSDRAYIDEYLKDCFNYEEEAMINLALLRKRGFYIDSSEEGQVSLNEISITNDKDSFVKYMKKSSIQIVEELFSRDSVIPHEAPTSRLCKPKWIKSFGSNTLYGENVPTLNLEPFIARLVHSLAMCGIFTYYSCDGWHSNKFKSRDAYIKFTDRYSMLWTDVILRNDIDLILYKLKYRLGVCSEGRGNAISFTFDNLDERFDSYYKIDKIAEIFYEKREYYRKGKIYLKKVLLGKKKTILSNEELYLEFEQVFRKYLKEFPYTITEKRFVSSDEINDYMKIIENYN